MRGNSRIVDMLNDILTGELTAVNQYFLGAKIARHRGYEHLAHKIYDEALGEMKHAERLMERILYLDGLPNVQKLEKVRVGEGVVEQLRLDLDTEKQSVQRLNAGIELARKHADNGTAELLEDLLGSAEGHVDWLQTQVTLVKDLGDTQYLAQQLHKG